MWRLLCSQSAKFARSFRFVLCAPASCQFLPAQDFFSFLVLDQKQLFALNEMCCSVNAFSDFIMITILLCRLWLILWWEKATAEGSGSPNSGYRFFSVSLPRRPSSTSHNACKLHADSVHNHPQNAFPNVMDGRRRAFRLLHCMVAHILSVCRSTLKCCWIAVNDYYAYQWRWSQTFHNAKS